MRLAPLSLTGLTDSKQKLYQMKLFLQKTANCTRSAVSYAAAPPQRPFEIVAALVEGTSTEQERVAANQDPAREDGASDAIEAGR